MEQSIVSWNKFDFVKTTSKKIVVTIGESWTWGDSLGKSDAYNGIDDKEFRLSNVYGGQLAKIMSSDFLNISEPGQSNLWIVDQFKTFIDHLDEFEYDEVFIILTLTEIGREFRGDRDSHRNYYQLLGNIESMNDFFNIMSQLISDDIQTTLNKIKNIKNKKVKIFLGTNFVESNYPKNIDVFKKSWVQLLANELKEEINLPCYVLSSWVLKRFDALTEYTEYYYEGTKRIKKNKSTIKFDRNIFLKNMNELCEISEKRINFLNNSVYNFKKATKHPTVEGHTIWMNYIYKELTKTNKIV